MKTARNTIPSPLQKPTGLMRFAHRCDSIGKNAEAREFVELGIKVRTK